MDLQSIFYIVSITAIILSIILMLVIIYFVISVKKMIANTQQQVMSKIIEYTKPVDVLKGLSTAIAGNLLLKTKERFGIK